MKRGLFIIFAMSLALSMGVKEAEASFFANVGGTYMKSVSDKTAALEETGGEFGLGFEIGGGMKMDLTDSVQGFGKVGYERWTSKGKTNLLNKSVAGVYQTGATSAANKIVSTIVSDVIDVDLGAIYNIDTGNDVRVGIGVYGTVAYQIKVTTKDTDFKGSSMAKLTADFPTTSADLKDIPTRFKDDVDVKSYLKNEVQYGAGAMLMVSMDSPVMPGSDLSLSVNYEMYLSKKAREDKVQVFSVRLSQGF